MAAAGCRVAAGPGPAGLCRWRPARARPLRARPSWLPTLARDQHWPDPSLSDWVHQIDLRVVGTFLARRAGHRGGPSGAGRGGAAPAARTDHLWRRPRGRVPKGATLLDASRIGGVPHASVCGGRGRCSTCRVRVTQVWTLAAAQRRRAPGAPPHRRRRRRAARLPAAATRRRRRHLAAAGRGHARRRASPHDPNSGRREREIAVLFADLRDFTRSPRTRLPYDVVFILNRYFAAMGAVVERRGGHVDKFVGDGIVALFGLDSSPVEGARQALAASAAMAEALATLNDELRQVLREPLRMGIGVHAGPAIVGELGWGRAVSLTAIGDTVNTASRLEALTKELRRRASGVAAGDRARIGRAAGCERHRGGAARPSRGAAGARSRGRQQRLAAGAPRAERHGLELVAACSGRHGRPAWTMSAGEQCQFAHFYKADPRYDQGVASAPGTRMTSRSHRGRTAPPQFGCGLRRPGQPGRRFFLRSCPRRHSAADIGQSAASRFR